MEDLFSIFSADHLTADSAYCDVLHSLRKSGNANDVPLTKIALWRVTLFCLYHG